ncbi:MULTISPECIES: hypothetical protein, partial [Brucella]
PICSDQIGAPTHSISCINMIVPVPLRLDYALKDRKGAWRGCQIVIEEFHKQDHARLAWGKAVCSPPSP